MKVLLCDSDTMTRASLARLLRMTAGSCEVVEVASGADAIARLERERFDLLILDTDLPLLDGFETMTLVRQTNALRHIPTIIVTRDRSAESVIRSRGFGVVDYMLKPVRHQRLVAALSAAAVHARRQPAPAVAPPLAEVEARQRTLIVDGDESFREALRDMLHPHCVVATAPSGAAALNDAWTAVPDVVLIGRDLGAIGPVPLVRYLSKLGTSGLVKVAAADEMTSEAESGLYSGVVGRSSDPAVVMRELRRFIRLPVTQSRGVLQQLLGAVPGTRDIIVRTTGEVFEARLSTDIDVRESGTSDVLGAHALVDMELGAFGVRLAVQSTTDLIRRLADAASGGRDDLHSSVAVLGDIATGLAGAIHAAAGDAGVTGERTDARFASAAAAREGLPEEAERLVVEMAPLGGDGRFRVVLDVFARQARTDVPGAPTDERLGA